MGCDMEVRVRRLERVVEELLARLGGAARLVDGAELLAELLGGAEEASVGLDEE